MEDDLEYDDHDLPSKQRRRLENIDPCTSVETSEFIMTGQSINTKDLPVILYTVNSKYIVNI